MNEKEDIVKLYEKVKGKGTFTYLRELDHFKSGEFYKFYLFLKANRQVLSILRYNYFQLIDLVNYHISAENHSKVWNNINSKYRWRQQRMITTQLFNYLTSVFATVDYSRSKVENYISLKPELESKFKLGKEAWFIKNPQHRFIQDLRNYTSHNSYLRISTEFRSNRQAKQIERNVYLLKEDLLNSDKWTSISKDFLLSQDTKVYIIDIINSHFPIFSEFQDWSYLALLQVDPNFTLESRNQLQSILDFAEKVNLARTTLPFNRSYIRYLNLIIDESTNRCASEFKYLTSTSRV
ncbi:hypothetical protein [Pontibacter sp. HSC-36F09]|uniref:hypothetical protein n=1 Tax=Pontibacter sp. HSC-36F09 TaxID=2910966 RepID=UPI00209E227E|nr:hypothetical protein [Pontibacter sp. HSC-36F09]MCP2042998.1 hypothetical protein [Pontibacter sp. HSC-36F09]